MNKLARSAILIFAYAILSMVMACSASENGQQPRLEGIAEAAGRPFENVMEDQTKQRLPDGPWGTTGLTLITDGELVLFTFDCADARISKRPELDSKGNFDVAGVFIGRRGGPIRLDDKPNEQPARFVGKVAGDILDLTISLTKSGEEIGKYRLKRGTEGRIRRCL